MMNTIKRVLTILIAYCSVAHQANGVHILKKYGKYISPAAFGIFIEKTDWFKRKVTYRTNKLLLVHIGSNSQAMYDKRFFFNIKIVNKENSHTYKVMTNKKCNILKEQDRYSTELLEKLMDEHDTTPFREMCAELRKLEELHCTYTELFELLLKHEKTPNPQVFVKELGALSQQDKLPPQFNTAFTKHKKRIDNMGMWSIAKYKYLYAIKQKFNS